jgi:hypothetical protein
MVTPMHHNTIAPLILPLLLIATMAFAKPTQAQSPEGDVHLSPRQVPEKRPVRQSAGDPSLSSKTRPLQVDVNLVLVPVTVTDPLQVHYKKGHYAPDTTYAQAR